MKTSPVFGKKDFWAGLILISFSLGAIFGARSYPIGTATHMGPAYLPLILGVLLALLGIAVGASSIGSRVQRPVNWRWRPLLSLLAPIVFACAIQPLGLILSTLLLVGVSCVAGSEYGAREAILLSFILAGIATVVFIVGLGLPLKVWP